jgi:hypothetical protein
MRLVIPFVANKLRPEVRALGAWAATMTEGDWGHIDA